MLEVFGVTASVMVLPPPPPQLEIIVTHRNAISAHASDGKPLQRTRPLAFALVRSARKFFIRAYTFNVVIAPWISFWIRPERRESLPHRTIGSLNETI